MDLNKVLTKPLLVFNESKWRMVNDVSEFVTLKICARKLKNQYSQLYVRDLCSQFVFIPMVWIPVYKREYIVKIP